MGVYLPIVKSFNDGTLGIPAPEIIENTNQSFPYVLVGDEAFPLKENLMKPYPREVIGIKERIYNYRLSRARRFIESTFSISSTRFRIFRRPIVARVDVVTDITKAVVALHNYLMVENEQNNLNYCPPGYADSIAVSDLRNTAGTSCAPQPIRRFGSNNYSRNAKTIRESFRDNFASNLGSVPLQLEAVASTKNSFDKS